MFFLYRLVRHAVGEFLESDGMAWAAAITFYNLLSLAPLILLMVSITDWLAPETQDAMIERLTLLMGEQAGGVIGSIVKSAEAQSGGQSIWAFAIGVSVAGFSASNSFVQLQRALNQIWEVRAKPGAGIMGFVRQRFVALAVLVALGMVLFGSIFVTTYVNLFVPTGKNWEMVGSSIISLILVVPMLMVVFKFLPDVKIRWRDVLFGALFTGVALVIGKNLIGIYLGHSAVGSAYGAAGSLVVLMVWLYYSAVILLFGAEITQARVTLVGRTIEPNKNAVRFVRDLGRDTAPEPEKTAAEDTQTP